MSFMAIIEDMEFFTSKAWVFLKPFATQLITNEGGIFLEIVQAAVQAVETYQSSIISTQKPMTSVQKKSMATTLITNQLEDNNITVSIPMINAAIEHAVINIQISVSQPSGTPVSK